MRTIVDSLKPLSGDVKWGHGCQVGVYAQHVYTSLPEKQTVLDYPASPSPLAASWCRRAGHRRQPDGRGPLTSPKGLAKSTMTTLAVYTSLPENQTVLDYLHRQAARGKNDQQILQVAGSLLFRGAATEKKISVLSGGERARLCLAGLLLSAYNILILDEPGNHLDVDTVDALAEALVQYEGTVIFTSHDRHFTRRVATAIVEVRDGRVVNYSGKYDAYVDKVNAEIEAGEPRPAWRRKRAKLPAAVKAAPKPKKPHRDEKVVRKEIKAIEKTIATLDEQKKALTAKSLEDLSAAEALRVHNELTAATKQLSDAEERWCELNEELNDE